MAAAAAAGAHSPPSVPCSGKHTKRLLIGEGNFSFALALINKHDRSANHTDGTSIAHSITATEYNAEIGCGDCVRHRSLLRRVGKVADETVWCDPCKATEANVAELRAKGATVVWGVDGTDIAATLSSVERYPRIHWNLPLGQDNAPFGKMLADFFASCRGMQERGDRVYITLLQDKTPSTFPGHVAPWIYQQGYRATLVLASTVKGYRLVKKRKCIEGGEERYPGYVTRNSHTGQPLTDEQLGSVKEFVFEKGDIPPREDFFEGKFQNTAQNFIDATEKDIKVHSAVAVERGTANPILYVEVDTDDDSTDYASSGESEDGAE